MAQQLLQNRPREIWKSSTLPGQVVGDLFAAAISSTLITPVLTAIDRAVVENAASRSRPLLATLKTNILCSFRHPRLFFGTKPFFIIWTLYAATYSTANTVETIASAFTQKADQVLVGSVTFLSTCLVNVPLGVWKDVRFVQLFGRPTTSNIAMNTPAKNSASLSVGGSTSIRPVKFPRMVGATFLFRDAITIFGAINLPPILSSSVPDSTFSNPAVKMAVMQFCVPVLSQVVATPIHLLGLDMYSHPHSRERTSRIKKNLGATTLVRCARIVPAFSVGCIVNTGLRSRFHRMAGYNERM